jgi:hypothetical protein
VTLAFHWQVHIEFNEEQEEIRLEGPPEDAEQAEKIIQDQLNELVMCCHILPAAASSAYMSKKY